MSSKPVALANGATSPENCKKSMALKAEMANSAKRGNYTLT